MIESPMETQVVTGDPVLADFELPLRGTYYPLGFTLEIATNSQDVLDAAEESWGCFSKIFSEPAVTLHVGVVDGGSDVCPPPPICRARRNLMLRMADIYNYSASDMTQGFSFAWLSPAVARNRAYMRYHFIEAMAWDLIDPLYLTAMHAACVSRDGHGVMLVGDSGAGKSSLAFACARRGWDYLSDDSTCLVRARKGRVVVGNPYQIRFRESAADIFPELKNHSLVLRASGEFALEIPTAKLPGIKIVQQASVDYILFLNRGTSRRPGFAPYPRHKALPQFDRMITFGEPAVRKSQRAALRQLFTAEVLEFSYSDIDSAVDLLEGLIQDGAPPPGRSGMDPKEGEHA